MARTGLYPGSFDPVTNGHVALIEAAVRLVDRLVVAIGVHPSKAPLLSVERRRRLLETIAEPLAGETGCEVVVSTFSGLVIEEARQHGAVMLFRGLRDGTDLDYEMQMAGMNGRMAPEVQTVFLPATPGTRHITATLVRQIAGMGGDVSPFVPTATSDMLAAV